MQYITQTITGSDGSNAQFIGYIIDNSPEIDEQRTRPAVLILPGGGYEITSDREAEPIALRFIGSGYHAFILRYSTFPSLYPTALLQAAAAMQLIRTHAAQWHVKADAICVLGFSAGGHLAANLSTTASDDVLQANGFQPNELRPNGLMLSYPVISSGEFAHRGSFDHLLGKQKDDPQMLQQLSLEHHIDSVTPPIFVWHTLTDTAVPVENTLMLISACRAAGVSIEAHIFPEGDHGLSLGTWETSHDKQQVVPAVQPWFDLAVRWLGRTLL